MEFNTAKVENLWQKLKTAMFGSRKPSCEGIMRAVGPVEKPAPSARVVDNAQKEDKLCVEMVPPGVYYRVKRNSDGSFGHWPDFSTITGGTTDFVIEREGKTFCPLTEGTI
jgi:hypothetical protein